MVRARGRRWQSDIVIAGERVRKSFATQAEAEKWEAQSLAEAEAAAKRAEEEANSGPTMKSVGDDAFVRIWKGTKNEKEAKRILDAIVAGFGADTRIGTVTASTVDTYVGSMTDRDLSAGTVNRHLAQIRRLLKFAKQRGYLAAVPEIEPLKEPEGRVRYYTVEEERAALEAATAQGAEDFRDLLVVLADTGCRLGEALRLTWGDVGAVLRFPTTKSGKPRAVPMTTRVRSTLAARRPATTKPGERVFPGMTKQVASKIWGRVRTEAQIEGDDAVLHTWRHTCASRLVQARVPIQEVQKWLGHASVTMTLRYAHLAPDALDAAGAALDQFVTASLGCDIPVTGSVSQCQRVAQVAA